MLINRENFQSNLSLLEKYIKDCDFASFDIEMTGISNELKNDGTTFDSHEFRYSKCREIVRQFEIIQFGLTLYKSKDIKKENANSINLFNGHEKIYIERTFNFQLLKNSKFSFLDSKIGDNIFSNISSFHPAALKFMNSSKFDFDSLFKNGIHYNKLMKQDKIHKILDEEIIKSDKILQPILYLSEKNEKILIQEIYEITKFLCFDPEEIVESQTKNINQENKKDPKIFNHKKLELIRENIPLGVINYLINLNFKKLLKITGFNIFIKEGSIIPKKTASIIVKKFRGRLIDTQFKEQYNSIDEFMNLLNMESIQKFKYKLDKDSPEYKEDNALMNLINEELGFAKVIEMLKEAKTRIVGHNIYFDILFLYDKFIDDLPKSFYEFKSNFINWFPVVYDTKYIVTKYASDFDHTKLESIYLQIQKDKLNVYTIIKQDICNGFAFYSEIDSGGSLLHDAGYDSILTGRCFIYLMKAIENNFCIENKEEKTNRIQNIIINESKEIIVRKGPINFNFSLTKFNIFNDDINSQSDNENDLKFHLQDFANKTILGLLESPFDTIYLDENHDDYEKREKNMIDIYFKNVFYFEFNDEFMTIYEMSRNINADAIDQFNLKIIKNSEKSALIEFKFVRIDLKDNEEEILNEMIGKLRDKSNIKLILPIKEYYLNNNFQINTNLIN